MRTRHFAVVDQAMALPAQHHAVLDAGVAVAFPFEDMVDLAPGRWASAVGAAAVAGGDGAADPSGITRVSRRTSRGWPLPFMTIGTTPASQASMRDTAAATTPVAAEVQLVDLRHRTFVRTRAVLVEQLHQRFAPGLQLRRRVLRGLGGQLRLGTGPPPGRQARGGRAAQDPRDGLDMAQARSPGGERLGRGGKARGRRRAVEPDARAHLLGGGDPSAGLEPLPAQQISQPGGGGGLRTG